GKPFAFDVGRFNRMTFIYVAACGLFSELSYETSQNLKKIFGKLAYYLCGFKSVLGIKGYHMTIEHDGHKDTGSFIYGMVSNSTFVGGVKLAAIKDAEFDDGMFEAFFIRQPKTLKDLQNIVGAMMLGNIEDQYMVHFKASHIKISSLRPVAWSIDGEDGGKHRHIRIHNLRQSMRIIRPAEYYKPEYEFGHYEIGGFKVAMAPAKGSIQERLKPYVTDEVWDEEEADIVIPFAEGYATRLMRSKRGKRSYDKAEMLVTAVRFYRQLIERCALVLRAAVVVVDGEGYALTADSKGGTEACVEAWKEVFGDRLTVMCKDKPLVVIRNDRAYACTMPWSDGADNVAEVPLKGMVYAVKGSKEAITKPDIYAVSDKLITYNYREIIRKNEAAVKEVLSRFTDKTPVYISASESGTGNVFDIYSQFNS
ncbi:MAG: hypothetical protein IJL97_05450, partial [Lachnospiraceae bacterium]|nr:hypothetical protein [Lachnospiraceae bacterium]